MNALAAGGDGRRRLALFISRDLG